MIKIASFNTVTTGCQHLKTQLERTRKSLRILTGKKHPKIQLQSLRKIQILTFGSLVHQINSF